MITQYSINGLGWTPISAGGQSVKAWIDEDNDGQAGKVDVRIIHSGSGTPDAGLTTEGKRIYRAGGNEDIFKSNPDSPLDIFYAKCANAGDTAIVSVDANFEYISQKTAFGELSVAHYIPLTGWAFTYNINPGVVDQETIDTGVISNNLGHAVLNTGSGAAGKAYINTIRSSRYIPGVGGKAVFTAVFGEPQENSQQVIGLINGSDGWAFGYNGLDFGILRKVNNVENWIPQNEWNINPTASLDPQKGNVFMIKYQWLGYGDQDFYIEDDKGQLTLVHKISYANQYVETSILNPNLPVSAYVVNTGNTIPITMKTPSASAGLEGDAFNDAISTNVSGDYIGNIPSALADVPLISFRMGSEYKSKANRLFSQILRVIFASEGNKPVLFRAYVGGIIAGGSWLYLDEERSPLEVNNTIASYTPGLKIGSFPLGKSDTLPVDLIASQVRLYANQTITITATTQGASDVVVSGNWKSYV